MRRLRFSFYLEFQDENYLHKYGTFYVEVEH